MTDAAADLRGYAVCCVPRSGSNYLCKLLSSSGVLGAPKEFFHGARREPSRQEAMLREVLNSGATPNGVYGLKMFAGQFDASRATQWATRLPNLRFIFLERRDLLGQAISWTRAMVTDQWHPGHEAKVIPYDDVAIAACLVSICRNQARWQYYFASNGIEPLRLVYEDVEADPAGALRSVGRMMGLETDPIPNLALVGSEKQRDEHTETWRARFIAERGDRISFH